MEYIVQLVDSNKSVVRHEIFKDEKNAFKKALKWHRLFPQNFICINNAIVYKMGV